MERVLCFSLQRAFKIFFFPIDPKGDVQLNAYNLRYYCSLLTGIPTGLFINVHKQKKLWNGAHKEEENEVDLKLPGRKGLHDWWEKMN